MVNLLCWQPRLRWWWLLVNKRNSRKRFLAAYKCWKSCNGKIPRKSRATGRTEASNDLSLRRRNTYAFREQNPVLESTSSLFQVNEISFTWSKSFWHVFAATHVKIPNNARKLRWRKYEVRIGILRGFATYCQTLVCFVRDSSKVRISPGHKLLVRAVRKGAQNCSTKLFFDHYKFVLSTIFPKNLQFTITPLCKLCRNL